MREKVAAVFCSAKDDILQDYYTLTRRVGELLASKNYNLIFGGDKVGMMGCIGKTMLDKGRIVTGVCVNSMYQQGKYLPACTQYKIVDNLMDRKKEMLDAADLVLVLPGGIGTINELLDAMVLKHLGLLTHPKIVLFNYQSCYNSFFDMLFNLLEQGFLSGQVSDYFTSISKCEQLDIIL